MALDGPGPQTLQVRRHSRGSLRNLRQFRRFELRVPHGVLDLGVKQRVAAAALILGQDPGPIQRHARCPRTVAQQT